MFDSWLFTAKYKPFALHLVSVVMSEIGTESPFTKTVVCWRYISKKQISHKHLDDNLVILVKSSQISTFDRTQQPHSLRTGIHCCPFSNAPSFMLKNGLSTRMLRLHPVTPAEMVGPGSCSAGVYRWMNESTYPTKVYQANLLIFCKQTHLSWSANSFRPFGN